MTAAWVNGTLVDPHVPAIGVLDAGFTHGLGVFETILVTQRRPLALPAHVERLLAGATRAGIGAPARAEIDAAVAAVLAAADLEAARLRILLTKGAGEQPTLAVTVEPYSRSEEFARVVTLPWRRNEHSPLVGLKTTSYAENIIARDHVRAAGADEGILGNTHGNLCEGTASNVFLVLDGQLLTPPLSSGCLPGIVREIVVRRCDVTQADMPLAALGSAQEVFLTSSLRLVQPVVTIDGRDVPAGEQARAASDAVEEELTALRTA